MSAAGDREVQPPALADPACLPWLSPPLQDADGQVTQEAVAHAFRIGRRWLLIPMDLPAEVAPVVATARLPFTLPWCLGLANVRGEVVPVYDLGRLLEEDSHRRLLLVLRQRAARAALCIDEITLVRVPTEVRPRPLSTPPNLPDALTCLGLELGGRVYLQLDLGGLLTILAQGAARLRAGACPL